MCTPAGTVPRPRRGIRPDDVALEDGEVVRAPPSGLLDGDQPVEVMIAAEPGDLVDDAAGLGGLTQRTRRGERMRLRPVQRQHPTADVSTIEHRRWVAVIVDALNDGVDQGQQHRVLVGRREVNRPGSGEGSVSARPRTAQ